MLKVKVTSWKQELTREKNEVMSIDKLDEIVWYLNARQAEFELLDQQFRSS